MNYPIHRIQKYGSKGILVTWAEQVEVQLTALILEFEAELVSRSQEIGYSQAAINSLAMFFKNEIVDLQPVQSWILSVYSTIQVGSVRIDKGRLMEIPVCYDHKLVPELSVVSDLLSSSPAEIIHWHASIEYHVFMIGFTPGFPYIGKLPESLHISRKSKPSKYMKPGSVAISGAFTGIYPVSSPGGWHVIGHTPLQIFDPHRSASPNLLQRMDRVRFVPINLETFHQMKEIG